MRVDRPRGVRGPASAPWVLAAAAAAVLLAPPAASAQYEQAAMADARPVGPDGSEALGPEDGLDLTVVDARDGSPLAGVRVEAVFGRERREPAPTDAEGRHRVAFSRKPRPFWQWVWITAAKEGFVPAELLWSGRDFGEIVPRSYVLALRPGTAVGGTVRDARGAPIAGARVHVAFRRPGVAGRLEQAALPDGYFVVTDADGRWRTTTMPADLGESDLLSFRLSHPGFVSGPENPWRAEPIPRLRAETSVMTMEDGVPLAGRVVDGLGRPVAGAKLGLSHPSQHLPPGSGGGLRAEADAEGRFRYGHVLPGRYRIGAEADGHAYLSVEVEATGPGDPGVVLRMATLREVVDAFERAGAEAAPRDAFDPREITPGWVVHGVLIVVAAVVVGSIPRRAAARRAGESTPGPS